MLKRVVVSYGEGFCATGFAAVILSGTSRETYKECG